jgi:N6-L-threonylcarbamoyladenine synthase
MPSLVVGVAASRALAWQTKKPILGINHLDGHLAANLLPAPGTASAAATTFPTVALIVSGGHTQLVVMRDWLDYEVIGETRDDAAGEAFDKVAKLIGLPFPGGPPIAALAAKEKGLPGQGERSGEKVIKLPRPMMDKEGYDFSFSGLKTAVLYYVRDTYPPSPTGRTGGPHDDYNIPEEEKAALCAEFQQAIVDVLIAKTVRAAKEYGAKTVMLGGGVAANAELRRQLGIAVAALPDSPSYLIPGPGLAVDNGAMIAAAAYLRWQQLSETDRAAATWQHVAVQL